MKIKLVKIITFLLIITGVVFWGWNYVFLSQNGPRTKAAGEVINLSFNPAPISAAVNQDFIVKIFAKPSINALLRGYETRVNFDKTKLRFKSIQYLVGSVSSGLGQTDNDATSINNVGQIKVIGESQSATGYSLTSAGGADLVNLVFTVLNNSSTPVTLSNSSFYSINSDMSLFNGWTFAYGVLSVNGVSPTSTPINTQTPIPTTTTAPGEPSSTPVPRATRTPTPTSTLTPIPTLTTAPGSPTLTPVPNAGGNVNLTMMLRFQGINKLPVKEQSRTMAIKVTAINTTTDIRKLAVGTCVFDAATVGAEIGKWNCQVSLDVPFSPAGLRNYNLLIKGESHLQKKVCDQYPEEVTAGTYGCSANSLNIALNGANIGYDFSKIIFLVGDLDQNGIVDSVDFALVRNNLGKTDIATLAKADLNRDGRVDTQDFSLIIAALGVRVDEQ